MNRFRQLGFVEYNGRIRVHKSLLNVILHDQLSDDNSTRPVLDETPRRARAATGTRATVTAKAVLAAKKRGLVEARARRSQV